MLGHGHDMEMTTLYRPGHTSRRVHSLFMKVSLFHVRRMEQVCAGTDDESGLADFKFNMSS